MARQIALIVQARMTSTRLPGKVMLPVTGQPLLKHLIDRLKRIQRIQHLIMAITTNPADDVLDHACNEWGIPTLRGSEHDVLDRYVQAAQSVQATDVMRITSDCPCLDPELADAMIDAYLQASPSVDYMSNNYGQSFYPRGLDMELMTLDALLAAHQETTQAYEREHVTPFLYEHPERFHCKGFTETGLTIDYSHHRWTVDTPEDFELIRRLLETLLPSNPHYTWRDVVNLLDQHPDWVALNAEIPQKSYKTVG